MTWDSDQWVLLGFIVRRLSGTEYTLALMTTTSSCSQARPGVLKVKELRRQRSSKPAVAPMLPHPSDESLAKTFRNLRLAQLKSGNLPALTLPLRSVTGFIATDILHTVPMAAYPVAVLPPSQPPQYN